MMSNDKGSAFSHATIIWGSSEAERMDASMQLAAAMICIGEQPRPCKACVHCRKAFRHIHPDIAVIDRLPDKREILVDQIRALREDAVILPNEAERKVYILRNADCMNTAAQNAILKLLEEPPSRVGLILEAENPASLLATVRSRCVEHRAGHGEVLDSSGGGETAAAFYHALTAGGMALATFTFSLEKLDRNKFIDFIDSSKTLLTAKLKNSYTAGEEPLAPDYLLKAIETLGRAGDYFDMNVSIGHIAGMLCAELIDTGSGRLSSSRPR